MIMSCEVKENKTKLKDTTTIACKWGEREDEIKASWVLCMAWKEGKGIHYLQIPIN